MTFYLYFNFNPERYVNHKSPNIIINSLSACALQESAQKVAQLGIAVQKKLFKTCNFSSFNPLKALHSVRNKIYHKLRSFYERETKAGTYQIRVEQQLTHTTCFYDRQCDVLETNSRFQPFKDEAQTALFKAPVRTAL